MTLRQKSLLPAPSDGTSYFYQADSRLHPAVQHSRCRVCVHMGGWGWAHICSVVFANTRLMLILLLLLLLLLQRPTSTPA